MKNPLEIIKGLNEFEWVTRLGGIIYAFAIFSLTSIVLLTLSNLEIKLGAVWVLIIIFCIQLLHFFAWIIKRNYFNDPDLLTIAFGISTEESSKLYYREIKKKFREQVSTHHLEKDIKIKELPSDIKFTDSKLAEEYIIRKGIRLLVWGNTTEGNIKDAHFAQFNIKLSYQHNIGNKEKQKRFAQDIGVAVQRGMWGISKPNSFHHLIVVSGNVVEISLFTLGACLATVPNINYLLKSIEVFEALQVILKDRIQDANFPNLNIVRQKTRSILRDAYTFLIAFYWNEKKDLDKGIELAEKAIGLDENNFIAHQNMSLFQWLKGDVTQAKYHTERAWRIRPGHPLPRFNKAFFFMYDKKYIEGLKQYKKIEYAGDTNILDVISFIENEFEKTTEHSALLFTAGWLNIQYADQVRGNGQLRFFIEKTKDDKTFDVLTVEAQKMIDLNSR